MEASLSFLMLFKAFVLLEQFLISFVKVYLLPPPQIEADLEMQTNMHLRSLGRGTSLCAFPGIAANLSEVTHESAQKVRIYTQEQSPGLVPPTNASWCWLYCDSTCHRAD